MKPAQMMNINTYMYRYIIKQQHLDMIQMMTPTTM